MQFIVGYKKDEYPYILLSGGSTLNRFIQNSLITNISFTDLHSIMHYCISHSRVLTYDFLIKSKLFLTMSGPRMRNPQSDDRKGNNI